MRFLGLPGLKRRGAGGIVCGMRRNFPEIVGCAVAAGFSSLIASAAPSAPQYHLPLDGDAAWAGRDAARARPAVVYGAAKWTEGVSGKGLDVSRWAYDQTTALVADALPGVSTRRGAVAFWFRPHWEKGDGEKHVVLSARSPAWRPLRIYFVKGKDGRLDVSFVEKHQVQFLLGEFFEKDVWTHVALSWDARDGSVILYRDGAPVGRKVDPGAFDVPEETTDLLLQCGDGTDRFNACVGDGVYDDIRLYDEPLSEAEAFLLADGGAATAMRPLASPPSGTFSLAHRDAFLAGTAPLLRFRSSGGATFTLRATGTSRGLALDGATDGALVPGATSADSLALMYRRDSRHDWHAVSFDREGNSNSGYLVMDGLWPGEYTLAIVDREHLGIARPEYTEVQLFPNPLQPGGALTVEVESEEPFEVAVFDLGGRQVWHQTGCHSGQKLSPALAKGTYFVRIENNFISLQSKLIQL